MQLLQKAIRKHRAEVHKNRLLSKVDTNCVSACGGEVKLLAYLARRART